MNSEAKDVVIESLLRIVIMSRNDKARPNALGSREGLEPEL